MEAKQFIKLSKEGESSRIEYKTCYDQISYSLYESVCSFLNHNGGFILIGVNDKGKIIGVNPDKIQDLKNNIISTVKNKDLFLPTLYLTPEIVEIEDKVLMALNVPCGQYVYRYNGRYFDRNGEIDLDITDHPELLLSLFERKNPHLFEERFVDGLTISSFSNRYDDRRSLRCNLITVYNELIKFTERYLPDKFYLPTGSTRRVDLRLNLFREIIANLCVHSDYSSGYACFYHVFKDMVLTKNPSRLLPEIPEGALQLEQLNNYTKNPLLVKVFHELSWAEDMGSGTRNILRYAPLYHTDYKVEILNGSHFTFSITYIMSAENIRTNSKMPAENDENVLNNKRRINVYSNESYIDTSLQL